MISFCVGEFVKRNALHYILGRREENEFNLSLFLHFALCGCIEKLRSQEQRKIN